MADNISAPGIKRDHVHAGSLNWSSRQSGTQSGNYSIYKFLFVGPGCPYSKLFTGLFQHRDGQLSQGSFLHVSPQLFFWHLHFGLLLGFFAFIICKMENAYTDRLSIGAIYCIFNNIFQSKTPHSPDLICVLQLVCSLGCNWPGKLDL